MGAKRRSWKAAAGGFATYIGSVKRRRGHMLQVIAEARGGRMVVSGIGRDGKTVRFTVATKHLGQPQPQLF